jgi:hypothetical protein
MKPLLKSLRTANRYILIQYTDNSALEQIFTPKSFENYVLMHMTKICEHIPILKIGEYNLNISTKLLKNPYAIIMTNGVGKEKICDALQKTIDNFPHKIITVSGTLLKIKQKIKLPKIKRQKMSKPKDKLNKKQ